MRVTLCLQSKRLDFPKGRSGLLQRARDRTEAPRIGSERTQMGKQGEKAFLREYRPCPSERGRLDFQTAAHRQSVPVAVSLVLKGTSRSCNSEPRR